MEYFSMNDCILVKIPYEPLEYSLIEILLDEFFILAISVNFENMFSISESNVSFFELFVL